MDTPSTLPKKSEERSWQKSDFDSNMRKISKSEPGSPEYIAGVKFDAVLDEMNINRIMRPKNLPTAPQGNEPGKIYWDMSFPSIRIWVNSNIGWFDLINRLYGSMYIYTLGGPGVTINCAVTQTFYQVSSGISSGTLNGFTFQNSRELVVPMDGKYLVTWSMSLSAGANTEVEGTVMVNGNYDTQFAAHAIIPSANKDCTVSGSGIIGLLKSQLISLAVMNESGTGNVIVDHLTLSIMNLGL